MTDKFNYERSYSEQRQTFAEALHREHASNIDDYPEFYYG